MSLLEHSCFWNGIITFPLIRKMLMLSLKKCDICGRQVLDSALDKYVGRSVMECGKCGFSSNMIIFWTEFLRKSLSIEREKVEKVLADPYARRGIKSVVNAFIHLGIRKPLTVYAPFLVVWDFTYRCNLNCRHCYSNAGVLTRRELGTKEALKVVDQLADFGVVSLAFSGGEPLMRKDFFEVAEHAVDSGLYVSLATNGTLLNKQNVKKLKEIGVHYVEVSIDGSNAKFHDDFRGVPGAFDLAITGLKNCVEEGLCTSVAVTATKRNFKDLPKVLELAEKVGAARFALFNFVPVGRGSEIISQDLSPDEREEVMLFLMDKLLSGSKVTILTTTPQLARVALSYQKDTSSEFFLPMAHMQTSKVSKKTVALADFIGGCGAGRLYCSISPEGEVHPCVFLPIKVGDLKTDTFADLWLNSEIFEALRNRENLKGSCGVCQFKYVCGGCRARAYAYTHDMLASDPGCMLVEKCT